MSLKSLSRQCALDGPALVVMRVPERELAAAIGCVNRVVDIKYLGSTERNAPVNQETVDNPSYVVPLSLADLQIPQTFRMSELARARSAIPSIARERFTDPPRRRKFLYILQPFRRAFLIEGTDNAGDA
jgi:hypothetical protein